MAKPGAGMTPLEKLTRALVGVPKGEVDEKAKKYEARRRKKRRARAHA